jgi:hypothetical protein
MIFRAQRKAELENERDHLELFDDHMRETLSRFGSKGAGFMGFCRSWGKG